MPKVFHSISWHFVWYILSLPKARILSSSKMQSACLAVNKSPVRGSRYFMIDGDLYPHISPIFYGDPLMYAVVVKSVRIPRIRIFVDGKYLVDFHVLTTTGKPCDMQ